MKFWMAVVAVIALACGASAATTTVKVTPQDMSGWVLGTQEANNGAPIPEFVMAGPGEGPAGSGCFRFFTDVLDGYDPLEKIYLGTNNHSGVALNDITSFKYYTYLHSRGYDGVSGWPDGQPPIIEIITDSGASTQQRRFVFKPWGWWGGHNVAKDTWQEWDLMADMTPDRWQMLGTNATTNCSGDWTWVKGRYSSTGPMHFATPVVGDYLDYWDDDFKYANQSGTSISIRVGSGRAQDWMFNQDLGQWQQQAWWRESCGIDAYADKLVIGINGEETVYDFGNDAMTVGIGTGACRDHIMVVGKKNFFFAVFGKVLADPAPTGTEFYLDDGTGKKIKVMATNAAEPDQYYRAKGTLQWNAGTSRYDLMSSPYNINRVD
jgi:hypothetical protein